VLILEFIIACSLVIYSGIQLTRKGDQLEEIVGISAGFVGTVLLAMTTSLPEFVATFSSIYRLNAPQLALGNVFGSNTFNLAILGVMDLFFVREALYHRANHYVLKALAVGQILTALALLGVYLNGPSYTFQLGSETSPLLTVNLFTAIILVAYIATFKDTSEDHSAETEEDKDEDDEASYTTTDKAKLIGSFAFFALLVVVSGIFLTDICDKISIETGLGKTFIGSILLAFATSLPEATVCATAVKLGSFDLVFGNVLGSNIFNIFILAIADFATPKLALLNVEFVELNLITGLGSLAMSSLVLFAMFSKEGIKSARNISIVLLVVYFATYYIMFVQQKVGA